MNTPYRAPVWDELAALSARLGADPLLIQAAGGNTSIKDGDTLWVKASGLWLSDALRVPSYVPLRLRQVRALMNAQAADPVGPALITEQAPPGLRPSIETTLHALLPHRVVLHVHAVDAIAWCCLPGAANDLATPLQGLAWAWLPYARPGLDLTQALRTALATQGAADLLLMQNHGLVVGGDNVAQAEARLMEALARLRRPVQAVPCPDLVALAELAQASGWALPTHTSVHGIATDATALLRAAAGVLYPDHVVFLGTTLAQLAAARNRVEWAQDLRALAASAAPPPCVALPGLGLLVREHLSASAQEMLRCLVDVLLRLPTAPEPVYLSAHEAQELAHWEAEKFRQQNAR